MATEKLIRASDARRAILKEDPKLAYCIDEIPGVDAVEVRRGRWSLVGDACVCSVCHKSSVQDYYFCPECGADMRGDNDGK